MELREYGRVLRRGLLTILIAGAVGWAIALLLVLTATPRYTASTQIFFAVDQGTTVTDLTQGSTFTERQMSAYARVATSPLVLNRVISDVGLGVTPSQLAKNVTVVPIESVILEISATDASATQAAAIANAVGKELATVSGELVPGGAPVVQATTLTPAVAPTQSSSPAVLRYLVIGLAFGLLLGIAYVLLRHVRRASLRTQRDVRDLTDSEVLGVVPFDPEASERPVVMHSDSSGSRAEAVRRLRTNIQYIDAPNKIRSILVTSSIPGEGRTTTAINLAVSFADAGLRVVLVDADLRRPQATRYLSLPDGSGLTSVLQGTAELEGAVTTWEDRALDVLQSGPVPSNPSELLASHAMATLMERLSASYDVVVLDSPPLLPVTDAAVLSTLAGATVVVVGVDQIRRPELRDALESLTTVGANVLGLVLNKIAKRDTNEFVYSRAYEAAEKKGPSAAARSRVP